MPGPAGGAYSALPDPLTGFEETGDEGGRDRGKEQKGDEREGEGRKGRRKRERGMRRKVEDGTQGEGQPPRCEILAPLLPITKASVVWCQSAICGWKDNTLYYCLKHELQHSVGHNTLPRHRHKRSEHQQSDKQCTYTAYVDINHELT